MTSSKETLREQARRHRAQINTQEENPESAVKHFIDALTPQSGQVLAAYWPKDREFDPVYIMQRARTDGLEVALPVVQPKSKILKFAHWDPDMKLEKGAYDILHPKDKVWVEPDIVLVPLLAFDRRGYRLGQGGGYYDATLASLRAGKEIKAVGVGYATQAVLFNLPVENHDEKLDMMITPQGVHHF